MFGTLLLLLFIIFIVIPFFRILWRVWQFSSSVRKARRQMDDAMNSAFGGNGSRPRQQQPRQQKKKKIDPSVGEYVAFEEVSVTAEETTDSDSSQTRTVVTESQIEDAVWEEIK